MLWMYWLLAVLCSSGCAYLVFRADKKRAVPYPWLTALLRGAAVLLITVLLFFPAFTLTRNIVEKPVIIHLQDNSLSIGVALGADSSQYRLQTGAQLDALSDKFKVVRLGFSNHVRNDSTFVYDGASTNISSALLHIQEFYGLDNVGAVVVGTDGLFNLGANPIYQQLAINGSLYTIAIGDSAAQKDLRIAAVYANRIVSVNTNFEIRVDVTAVGCMGYDNSISLMEGNTLVASLPVRVNAERFDRPLSFMIKAGKPGLHHYTLLVPPATGENNAFNNRKEVFVEIAENRKKILIAYASPHPDINAIKEALAGIESYTITTASIDKLPTSLTAYDAIVLHGLPSLRSEFLPRIRQAARPVWFIVTGQSNLQAINALSDIYGGSISAFPMHDVLPVYNTAFNLFNLPAGAAAVTENLPPLSTISGKITAMPSGSAIYMQKGNTATDNPVWLLLQGNTSAAILAGEGLWRWRLYEYKTYSSHLVVDECIRQTVAYLLADSKGKPFTVDMTQHVWKDREPVSLRAFLLNSNKEQINWPEAQIIVTDSSGKKQQFTFERSGNSYFLNMGIWAGGSYTYTAKTVYNGQSYSATGSFVVESTPSELLERGANYPLLYSLAKKYNGSFATYKNINPIFDSIRNNNKIKPLLQQNIELIPLVDNKWYFLIIVVVLITEWLLRKYWMAQ